MKMALIWLQGTTLAALVCAILLVPASRGGDIGYIEEFSLARDRADALKQLIPGTEDYYYYHCLLFEQQGRVDEARKFLESWIRRHARTARVEEIVNRQALLLLDREPKPSW